MKGFEDKFKNFTAREYADLFRRINKHSHKCLECGNIWCHSNDTVNLTSKEEFDKAHTCDKCGTMETYKEYTPDGVFACVKNSPVV